MVRTAWLRLLLMFIRVAAVARCATPCERASAMFFMDSTCQEGNWTSGGDEATRGRNMQSACLLQRRGSMARLDFASSTEAHIARLGLPESDCVFNVAREQVKKLLLVQLDESHADLDVEHACVCDRAWRTV